MEASFSDHNPAQRARGLLGGRYHQPPVVRQPARAPRAVEVLEQRQDDAPAGAEPRRASLVVNGCGSSASHSAASSVAPGSRTMPGASRSGAGSPSRQRRSASCRGRARAAGRRSARRTDLPRPGPGEHPRTRSRSGGGSAPDPASTRPPTTRRGGRTTAGPAPATAGPARSASAGQGQARAPGGAPRSCADHVGDLVGRPSARVLLISQPPAATRWRRRWSAAEATATPSRRSTPRRSTSPARSGSTARPRGPGPRVRRRPRPSPRGGG